MDMYENITRSRKGMGGIWEKRGRMSEIGVDDEMDGEGKAGRTIINLEEIGWRGCGRRWCGDRGGPTVGISSKICVFLFVTSLISQLML